MLMVEMKSMRRGPGERYRSILGGGWHSMRQFGG